MATIESTLVIMVSVNLAHQRCVSPLIANEPQQGACFCSLAELMVPSSLSLYGQRHLPLIALGSPGALDVVQDPGQVEGIRSRALFLVLADMG